MLLNVHVKNLALIEESEVYFKEGLNILTGETGAGKSIIIGSINIALGNKLPKAIVRDGAEYGLAELVFETRLESVKNKLSEHDIPYEDGQLIISRKIVNNRSVIKVNGQTVSATILREITSLLIDIHGQHDSDLLMNKSKHLDILDEYGENEILNDKKDVEELYRSYRECKEEIARFDIDESGRDKEMAFLEFQIAEIEDANLTDDEDVNLEDEYKKMSHSKKIVEALNTVYGAVGASNDNSFSQAIGYGIKEISSVMEYDERMQSIYESLVDVDSICNDLAREVTGFIDEMSFDEERVLYVTQRLDLINKLKMKYGKTMELIREKRNELSDRFELLNNAEAEQKRLKEKCEKIEAKLSDACKRLSKSRRKVAKIFEEELKKELMDLNFLEVNFCVDFKNLENYTQKGTDIVEFYISTNSGEKLKPLSEVASGGELSRIMLGLKSMMAEKDEIETLIFDEIDTGISGRTAQMVSEKMNKISKNHQVMAITHLPQIAAMADNHYLIEKNVNNGKTITQIRELDNEASVMELARILGGMEITDTVIESAREMKKLAAQTKSYRMVEN